MLEMLINPAKAERKPWEMFFIGFFYATIAVLLTSWIFSKDPVLSANLGILTVTFTVMFSLPFVYYVFRLEEARSVDESRGVFQLLKDHRAALWAFLWLFIGFVVGYSFWYIILPTTANFTAQIDTFCAINKPGDSTCNMQLSALGKGEESVQTVFATNAERLFLIFANNIYVLIFTLIFSLLFGAGVIFILAWNASVIAAAIGIFTKSNLNLLPLALLRYMVHGIFEIGSYFVAALAGGIISFTIIRREVGTDKFWKVLQDALNLVILAVAILFIAALMEVFVTPLFFN